MKILFVHAHYDDFEFTTSGTFELWRQKLGEELEAKVLVCTDGRAGHHRLSPEETATVRYKEQQQAAQIGQYEFELLCYPDGRPIREACLLVTTDLLAALWNAIREFEPDYLFCPPLPSDRNVGIHNDHWTIAEAVRRIAYMINVPHAFVEEFPDQLNSIATSKKTPIILTVADGYMGGGSHFDFAVNVEQAFDVIAQSSFCHQSQIAEWLPWVGRHNIEPPRDLEEWKSIVRNKLLDQQKSNEVPGNQLFELFTVTAWGTKPSMDRIVADFPNIDSDAMPLANLAKKLSSWT